MNKRFYIEELLAVHRQNQEQDTTYVLDYMSGMPRLFLQKNKTYTGNYKSGRLTIKSMEIYLSGFIEELDTRQEKSGNLPVLGPESND